MFIFQILSKCLCFVMVLEWILEAAFSEALAVSCPIHIRLSLEVFSQQLILRDCIHRVTCLGIACYDNRAEVRLNKCASSLQWQCSLRWCDCLLIPHVELSPHKQRGVCFGFFKRCKHFVAFFILAVKNLHVHDILALDFLRFSDVFRVGVCSKRSAREAVHVK